MDARAVWRSVRVAGTALRPEGRGWWPGRRRAAPGGPVAAVGAEGRGGAERARVPGSALAAEPLPGGGTVRFARASLSVRVAVGGAVFCGWDGAAPEPSYALAGHCPPADTRATLEPDKDGGWRVVSERLLVTVSRHGAVELRTPGGALLRRELPPRWWAVAGGAEAAQADGGGPPEGRWLQCSEVPADARFHGLGVRAAGLPLPDGGYRLWNAGRGATGHEPDPLYLTVPVQLVVADAGTHLAFYDNTWDGRVTFFRGAEGEGSHHDRLGRAELRMAGGPLRYWVLAGPPARVLHGWTRLTGAPALPPGWALGHQHARRGLGGTGEVRRAAEGYRERGLPLGALHLDVGHYDRQRVFTVDPARFAGLPALAARLRAQGVRLVSAVGPGVRAVAGDAVYDSGASLGAFVRDASGREVRVRSGRRAGRRGRHRVAGGTELVYPDFTDPRVRKWWGELHAERLAQGFAGVWHDGCEPALPAAGAAPRTLPLSARHELEGRGGDHREAHNVYALAMADAAHAGLRTLRPQERPFLLSRSGWAGLQRYGGAWLGEVESSWAGLRAVLSAVLGLGLCGVPYAGADVGGSSGEPSPELYVRWFQLAAYLPLFRTYAGRGTGRREPWEFGPEVLAACAAAMRERERLRPYFGTLAQLAHRTGAPYVRPLWWQHSRDRALRECGDAFLLGDALLVAPVLAAGVRRRSVRLPRGRWYDTVTGAVHEGPGEAVLPAPLARVPVLARAGAAIPVAGADGGTELEVWSPAPGRTGSGLVIADPGEGWQRPEAERFTVRRQRGRAVVARENGAPVGYPVRTRC